MTFQSVRTVVAGVACAFLAACQTTAPPDALAVHTSPVDAPSVLTRIGIAQDYRFASTGPIERVEGADASFALPHETPSLAFENMFFPGRLGDVSDAPGRFMVANADVPKGWAWTANESVLHAASGLECPISIQMPEEERRFLLTDLLVLDAASLDIGCNYATGEGAAITLYASFWPEMTLEDSIGSAVEAIVQRFPVRGQLPVQIATLVAEDAGDPVLSGLEEAKATAFDIGDVAGVEYKTALWLVKTKGWHVKARATYPKSDATSEFVAAIMHVVSHVKVRAKNLNEPLSAGGEV